jgi:Polyketide cyclase / dehydrase and lipid transport
MGRISVATELDATPAAVWDVVEPVERHVDWMADAVAIHFETDQTRGVGTRFLCDTKVGPVTLQDRMEITVWEPGARMGVRHTGIVTGSGVFELEPIDLGRRTRFTWTEELRFQICFITNWPPTTSPRRPPRYQGKRNLRELKRLVAAAPR